MKKILFKRIIGVLIFLIIMISTSNVFADDSLCELSETQKAAVGNLFNMNVERLGNNQFRVSINPTSSDKTVENEAKNTVFKITRLNSNVQDGSITLQAGKPVTISGVYVSPDQITTSSGKNFKDSYLPESFYVELESVDVLKGSLHNILFNGVNTNNCTAKLQLGFLTSGDIKPVIETLDPITIDDFKHLIGNNNKKIDCNQVTDNQFYKEYCRIRNSAEEAHKTGGNHSFVLNSDNAGDELKDKISALKCDPKKIGSLEDSSSNSNQEIKYEYLNKDYYYASRTQTIKSGEKYVYNLDCEGTKTEEDIVCKVTCDEAVEVEYGPPVASRAGLCFEYQVRITSYTTCHMSQEPNPPKNPSYCKPSLYCINPIYGVIATGGPNEDFDACVKSCDGGKYTSSCSNKCYKAVYGNSSLRANSTKKSVSELSDNLNTKKLGSTCSECHFYWSNGSLQWSCPYTYADVSNYGGMFSPYNFPQWFYPDVRGIPRARPEYGGCSDACDFAGCSSENYLVRDNMVSDREKNKAAYEKAIESCTALASCNKTTTYITMSVDYKDDKNNTKTINFPYTPSNEGGKKDYLNSETKTNSYDGGDSTILSYAGCYDKSYNPAWYQGEWSFAGTWMNNKTGTISYVKKGLTDGWSKIKNKFCIPLNAQDVNVLWWNYYYNKKLEKMNTSYKDSDISNSCYQEIKKQTSISEKDVESWNIRAVVEDFGHFKWDFNISCFYALNSSLSISNNEISCSPNSKNYRIRSVDLKDLFPAEDGQTTTESSTTGRDPGFNWSKYAEHTVIKNENYVPTPSAYATYVQKENYNIYSLDNLDYQFNLTPELLAQIKRDSANNNKFTDFKGESILDKNGDGVVHYKSDLIRNTLLGHGKIADWDAVSSCNNIVSYNSKECMKFTENDTVENGN